MRRVEPVEGAIQAMDAEELAAFRAWFSEYDWGVWDQQLERDANTGRLDRLADGVLVVTPLATPRLFEAPRLPTLLGASRPPLPRDQATVSK